MIICGLVDTVIGAVMMETVMAAHNIEHYKRFLRDVIPSTKEFNRHPEDFRAFVFCVLDADTGGVSLSTVESYNGKEFPWDLGTVKVILEEKDMPLSEKVNDLPLSRSAN